MKREVGCKSPRIRRDATSYGKLQRQLLERDGWRCQVCGSMQNLQVHHLKFRSQSGGNEEQNLITLCAQRHAQTHQKPTCTNLGR
jgi:5-methylcytosine-specific restriction endonuclease McrA